MNYIGNKRSIWICLTLFLILSCTDDINESSNLVSPGDQNQIDNKANIQVRSPISEMTENLNSILGPNDFYEYDVSLDNEFDLNFGNVHEFYLYKETKEYKYPVYSLNPFQYQYQLEYSVIYNEISFITIEVNHKLESEDEGQQYSVTDITTSFDTSETGLSWEFSASSNYIFGGIAVVFVSGRMRYKCIIAGVPIIYYDSQWFNITIDSHTGTPISFYESAD